MASRRCGPPRRRGIDVLLLERARKGAHGRVWARGHSKLENEPTARARGRVAVGRGERKALALQSQGFERRCVLPRAIFENEPTVLRFVQPDATPWNRMQRHATERAIWENEPTEANSRKRTH